jgi:2-polyprenyl-3-methyl-5-hydroxy-6-metoxy-1,4-benzoquinol methylase
MEKQGEAGVTPKKAATGTAKRSTGTTVKKSTAKAATPGTAKAATPGTAKWTTAGTPKKTTAGTAKGTTASTAPKAVAKTAAAPKAPPAKVKKNVPKALAFYLPQFHPIPENDEWWGRGFTEWTNVNRTRPLYPGHYQPHVPSELGYYDLRLPEVREAQADLAASHGISGFVYYHYWFHGKRLLERPFDEVLASGSPDLPFALCWANEEWTRNWDASTGRVLMPQEFSDDDDLAHIRWLANAFADDRYIKIDGRPLMLIYRAQQLPDTKRTTEIWRTEAQKLGFPDLYLCWVESHGPPPGGPEAFGLDASVGFMPFSGDQVFQPVEGTRGHRILDYESAYVAELWKPEPPWKRFPSVMVGWDNSARRPYAATIFEGATPEAYERWLRQAVDSVSKVRPEENYLFIVALNEWAEGNHLEPDQRYGRAFLEATRAVMLGSQTTGQLRPGELRKTGTNGDVAPEEAYDYVYPFQHDSAVGHAAGLVHTLVSGPESKVVDLGAGTAVVSHALREAGLTYHGLELHPVAVDLMKKAGIEATQCDLTDLDVVQATLDDLGDVGALMLLDVIEHLTQPQQLLATLSSWSLKHGEPALVVSVPNAAHFDLGLRLLCGRWTPTETGMLDSTHLRFFTEQTLERMFRRCGWKVVERDDYQTVHTDQYDRELNDGLPVEMIGALRSLSDTFNPNNLVQQFVWAMKPVPVTAPPASFLQAVGPEDPAGGDQAQFPVVDVRPVRDYLTSVGLVASEQSRRGVSYLPPVSGGSSLPWWKQRALDIAYKSPRTGAAFQKAYRRLR